MTVYQTRTEYVPLPAGLTPTVGAPVDPTSITTNGDLFGAWLHDSRELGICKPALDNIRAIQPKPKQ